MTDLKPLTSAELSDLKAKAKAATAGVWSWCNRSGYNDCSGLLRALELLPLYQREQNYAHVAAANPETVLRLIDMVERRDEQIEKLRKALVLIWRRADPDGENADIYSIADEALAATDLKP